MTDACATKVDKGADAQGPRDMRGMPPTVDLPAVRKDHQAALDLFKALGFKESAECIFDKCLKKPDAIRRIRVGSVHVRSE